MIAARVGSPAPCTASGGRVTEGTGGPAATQPASNVAASSVAASTGLRNPGPAQWTA
ncbi:hypothetical protein [Siccirubricoccus sp. G192]|uniref:hypothetical protein n=1 Tax=Siccirubricoccus sp. G192 TaxID=2849651 RepID=UPI001C2C4F66|nr:hypothetical protein [Siccirubricoccus sp. G192]MBV1798868.1 hypothetical protein [Siccirubricoccus sp. G192]